MCNQAICLVCEHRTDNANEKGESNILNKNNL